MTSKYALEYLTREAITSFPKDGDSLNNCFKCKRAIERDLEVLEMLKKHLFINSWGEIVYDFKHHHQYINGEECELFKHNEEDTKIKEWLEDE